MLALFLVLVLGCGKSRPYRPKSLEGAVWQNAQGSPKVELFLVPGRNELSVSQSKSGEELYRLTVEVKSVRATSEGYELTLGRRLREFGQDSRGFQTFNQRITETSNTPFMKAKWRTELAFDGEILGVEGKFYTSVCLDQTSPAFASAGGGECKRSVSGLNE